MNSQFKYEMVMGEGTSIRHLISISFSIGKEDYHLSGSGITKESAVENLKENVEKAKSRFNKQTADLLTKIDKALND